MISRGWQWVRGHPNFMAYLLIAGVFIVSLVGISTEADNRKEDICASVAKQQVIIKDLISSVTSETSVGGGFQFDAIPSFRNLDPQTQLYLIDLQERLSNSPQDDSLDERLAEFSQEHLVPNSC